ncbi:Rpn family recombination-promoting nuclease/putative transposase [Selenomonas sp. AB3002]|uniref:Rpn family recombination-promoting nuclease/putative transposase n=1 Tax=Selenomonas sp. AB3002 TaxID=1392502 RepID=UPI0004962362
MKPKRTYKDSLFRDIFNDKRRLQRIYHALTGKLIPLNEIKITTLRGTFFEDIKNDISFMAGNDFIILMEHQSTLSENLPLRMLWYISKLYRQRVTPDAPYKKTRITLPAPHFYVFYNGTDDAPEKWTMRLSDAFKENNRTLELEVTAFNINYAKNGELLQKCHDLKCYSIFVNQVRIEVAAGKTLRQAITSAIRYCKKHDLLADYFASKEQKEVFDMVNFKWDWNRAMEVRAEEAAEKASAETADAKTTEFVINMLREHEPYERISRLASTSLENVKKIAHNNNLAYN